MTFRELAVAVGVLSLSCWQAVAANELDPLPRTTRPIHYQITVTPDADRSTYVGHETVWFEVIEPTRDVVVHSVGLEIDSVHVDGKSATIRFDEARGQAIFRVPQNLDLGTHELQVSYSGSISEHGAEGIFTRPYTTADGVAKKPLFTMLCCLSAGRRFAPMWDQPDLKATFELELIVPQDLLAVSNMPVVSRESRGEGKTRLRFAPTPVMSSYLLFFALGDFERIQATTGATDVGIIVRRGMGARARTALESTTRLLQFYNDYFALPFPLPKLDSVGLTGAAGFGGMENWGSILYSERYLLADPRESSETDLRDSHGLIAHEVAHQWFGDLVTASAWDDLWLDEGFANWMEHKATEHFHPQWRIWMSDGGEPREAALRFDARDSSYAIVPNHSFEKEITYTKSGQVIRMLEAYVGEEAFREAMRSYLRKHLYGNATTAGMWAALGPSVADIGRGFVEQKGVPLIEVVSTDCAPGSSATTVVLRQDRFALDSRSRKRQTWRVPVTAAVAGDERVARQVVSGNKPTRLDVPGCGPVKINSGETGYFRTRYDAASFARLQDRFGALSPADQLGLLNDTYSLAEGGYASFDRYLDLAARVDAQADPMVLFQLASSARNLDRYFNGLPAQARFRAFARTRFGAILTNLGWTKQPGEAANRSIVRAQLIESLGQFQDADVIAEALRRFRGAELDPSIREAVLRTVAAGADAAVLSELLARAAASTDPADRNLLLLSAAGAGDPAVATQMLERMLGDSIPADLIPDIAQVIAQKHPELTFDFVTSHLKELVPRLEEGAHKWLVPSLLLSGDDPRLIRKLEAFAAKNLDAQDKRRRLPPVRSAIAFRDVVRKQRLAQIDAWLTRETK